MKLPHNAHTTPLSLDQAIKRVLANPKVEIDLAVSDYFWEFDGDLDEISAAYESHFKSTVAVLTKVLGKPVYSGDSNSRDFSEWAAMLPEFTTAGFLVVWERDDQRLYCRLGQEDHEFPIIIALGVEGCEASGVAYEGQFD